MTVEGDLERVKSNSESRSTRSSPLEMDAQEFRDLGYGLVDDAASFLKTIRTRSINVDESQSFVRKLVGTSGLPKNGTSPRKLLREASALLYEHSLFGGHPSFMAYVQSPAAPIGTLAEFLAASINPNVGAWVLSPVATEIERQTVAWIAEMIGYSRKCGGLLVSGGNMANFVSFVVARKASMMRKTRAGVAGERLRRLRVYASSETHTWIEKAADLFGLGAGSVSLISVDKKQRTNLEELKRKIAEDKKKGYRPFLIVGSAGTTATGAVDPLFELAKLAKEHGLWFHVDAAYGGFAILSPKSPRDLRAIRLADSVAVDPHKWLYAPLEAGCVLVRDSDLLHQTFSHRPKYYHFDAPGENRVNYYEYGFQNSRGFRALKVWLAIRQVGKRGYAKMIDEDIKLAKTLYKLASMEDEIEPLSNGLSITTLRYVPKDINASTNNAENYLNILNKEILSRIQKTGKLYPSNAVVNGKFALRFCIVNFRTSIEDIYSVLPIVKRIGKETDRELRKRHGRSA